MSHRGTFIGDVLDSLPTQIAVLDDEGTIQYTNRAWRTFGRDNAVAGDPEMLGENYIEVCDTADDEDATAVADGIRTVLSGERDEYAHEYPCHSPDQRRWFLMRTVPFESDGDRYALVVHLDITDRKLAELSVREQNERLDALTSVLAHDLRNPLMVATARTQLLAEEGVETEDILASLDRIDDIIDDALLLAEGRTVEQPEEVSLGAVARDAWAQVETGQATLEVAGDREVVADRSLLSQLFENLFRNSVEHAAAGDGGGLTVTVGPTDGGFSVGDDGPGIPDDDRDAVFVPGHTTSESGTGLGLDIVTRVADAHGWSVSIAESESGGARFEISGVESRIDADA